MSDENKHGVLYGFAQRAGEIVLSILLSTMLVLACAQIGMRAISGGSPSWIDPLLRYLVLWSGLFGAVVASLQSKHIAIDIASLVLPKSFNRYLDIILLFFSCLVSCGLLWASYLFIVSEFEYGGPGLFGLPMWQWNIAFPLVFAFLTIIYICQFIGHCIRCISPRTKSPQP